MQEELDLLKLLKNILLKIKANIIIVLITTAIVCSLTWMFYNKDKNTYQSRAILVLNGLSAISTNEILSDLNKLVSSENLSRVMKISKEASETILEIDPTVFEDDTKILHVDLNLKSPKHLTEIEEAMLVFLDNNPVLNSELDMLENRYQKTLIEIEKNINNLDNIIENPLPDTDLAEAIKSKIDLLDKKHFYEYNIDIHKKPFVFLTSFQENGITTILPNTKIYIVSAVMLSIFFSTFFIAIIEIVKKWKNI